MVLSVKLFIINCSDNWLQFVPQILKEFQKKFDQNNLSDILLSFCPGPCANMFSSKFSLPQFF